MKRMTHWFLRSCLAIAIVSFVQTNLLAAGPVAIKAGKLIPIVGDPIENAVILIRDGKIMAVGTDVEIPVEAKVIDASDKVVMPGFIDPHNPSGMSQANERNSNVPFLSAVDSIDPILDYFEDCRRNGITTTAVVPGNSTMIGGRGAVLKTAGSYVDDMLLRREAGLKISLQPVGGSRMSHLARLRGELDKAKRALEEKETSKGSKSDSEKSDANADQQKTAGEGKPAENNGNSSTPENSEDGAPTPAQVDEGLEVLKQVVRGEMPVFIYCDQAMDVGQAVRLIDAYGLDAILVLGANCYEAGEMLAKLNKPVILDPKLVFWKTDPLTRKDEQIVVPRAMLDAGVSFVFQTDNNSRQTLGSGFLWYQAATAIKYGMPRDAALRALTLTPAELLGINEFVGSVEPGKDADLIVLSGDPLAVDTWVEMTLVAGEEVYNRSSDQKLKRLIVEPAE